MQECVRRRVQCVCRSACRSACGNLHSWLGEEQAHQGLVRTTAVERLLLVVHSREVSHPRPLHLKKAQAHAELAHPQMGPPNIYFGATAPQAAIVVLELPRLQPNVSSRTSRGPPLLVLQLFFMPAGGLDPRALG